MIFSFLGGGVYSKGAFIRGGAFILKSEILGGVYSRKYGRLPTAIIMIRSLIYIIYIFRAPSCLLF